MMYTTDELLAVGAVPAPDETRLYFPLVVRKQLARWDATGEGTPSLLREHTTQLYYDTSTQSFGSAGMGIERERTIVATICTELNEKRKRNPEAVMIYTVKELMAARGTPDHNQTRVYFSPWHWMAYRIESGFIRLETLEAAIAWYDTTMQTFGTSGLSPEQEKRLIQDIIGYLNWQAAP